MSEVLSLGRKRPETRIRIGLLRLTDMAPAILAHELGYFAEEDIEAELICEPSWANIADKLAYGFLDAAIIVPPLAFAVALGLRGVQQNIIIPCNISLGGNTVTFSRELAAKILNKKEADKARAFASVLRETGPVMLGIVHAYSTHNLLLRYWLASADLEAGRDVNLTVVPPARTADALASGQIAGFCAGAPWGDVAARSNAGITIATSNDIWANAPEKAFAVRERWADENLESLRGAIRALLRAAQFCDAPENASYCAALLSRSRYVDVDAHAILSSLPGGAADQTNISSFWRSAATFPWRSHALWFLQQMARWKLIDASVDARAIAARIYRPDIYRSVAQPMGFAVPLTDEKREGAHRSGWELDALPGPIAMAADPFCDGIVFDPASGPSALHNI